MIDKRKHLRKRTLFEYFFRFSGLGMLGFAAFLLVVLLASVSYRGLNALRVAEVQLVVELEKHTYEEDGESEIDYYAALNEAMFSLFPQVRSRKERRELARYFLAARAPEQLQEQLITRSNPKQKDAQIVWIGLSDHVDDFLKSGSSAMPSFIRDKVLQLQESNLTRFVFNKEFFVGGDSREPEHAGIYAALVGSMWLMLVTFLISFPVGVLAAIYLQEFSAKNRLSDFIEININNLASVPSIIFGLMGLAIFLNWFGLPRGSPLVGGLVLSLMTLPTIIIATRAALVAVPPSIKEAALALGASQMQAVFHHVVPLALPGILTGSIIGMAQALGETAPLLMIGMVAFIADSATSALDPATALPVQIFIWADSPERGFADKASAAIIMLLLFLIAMNATATLLRKRFSYKW